MTEEVYRCQDCGSDDIEKFSDVYWLCKKCGLGTKGKPTQSFKDHLNEVAKAIELAKMMFPELTKKQLSFRVKFHFHRVQKHPENKHGYCEICQINYQKLTAEEFKEKTGGYTKEKWFETVS